MMRPCSKCLENNWKFTHKDGWVTANCNMCDNEVTFETKKASKKELKEGSPCVHCKTPVVIKESKFKPKKLNKPYYYTAYYWCAKCKKGYFSDEFKVFTGVDANADLKAML